jgi:hypothetical protein
VRRAGFFRGAEIAFEAAFQPDEGGLDVLAGAEAGGAEIRAGAGKRTVGEVADLDLIDHAAGRLHLEGGEDRVLGMEIGDRVFLVAGALDAAEDFVPIRGAPVGGGRQGDGGGFLFCGFPGGHNEAEDSISVDRWQSSKHAAGGGKIPRARRFSVRNISPWLGDNDLQARSS